MKFFILAALTVLITFVGNVILIPTPALSTNLCAGEDCPYPADNDDTPPYSAAALTIGTRIFF